MKRRLPASFYNPLSMIGAVMIAFNIGFMVFLTILDRAAQRPKPYADILIFIVLPLFVLIGLVLFIAGVIRERRRSPGKPSEERFPVLDFNDPKHRTTLMVFLGGFVLLSLLYAFAGYKTYEYTESDEFCALLCHSVHRVEQLSYSFSRHAEVGCASCHVGPGAKYFVLYKMKGTQQLFNLLTGRVPKPIPVPVKDLRPSQDVCENCHGPQYDVAERLETRTHFLSDEANTPWTVDLLLRMGKATIETDRPPKIHWHSSTTKEILYATTDPKRIEIPWIRVARLDGTERVYRTMGTNSGAGELNQAPTRLMDCIDCHNRAGHPYRPPAQPLNAFLALGLIDPALPEIKSLGMKALEAKYSTEEEALKSIRATIADHYQKKYPNISLVNRGALEKAIREVQNIYRRNYDPVMNVSWRDFPDNSGHLYSPGCFRCHDGKHVSEDGKVLAKDCNLCHLLIKHETEENREKAVLMLDPYPHPVDIGASYKEMNCSDCHGAAAAQ